MLYAIYNKIYIKFIRLQLCIIVINKNNNLLKTNILKYRFYIILNLSKYQYNV